jgi:hypothetical protein
MSPALPIGCCAAQSDALIHPCAATFHGQRCWPGLWSHRSKQPPKGLLGSGPSIMPPAMRGVSGMQLRLWDNCLIRCDGVFVEPSGYCIVCSLVLLHCDPALRRFCKLTKLADSLKRF